MQYKGYVVPDDVIDSYVDKLGCSIVEACDAWLCDHGKEINAEQDEMSKKAQFMGVGKMVDAEYKKAERKPREKKVNAEKRYIMKHIWDVLYSIADDVTLRNAEKYIDFSYEGKNFTLNLVEHRKEK